MSDPLPRDDGTDTRLARLLHAQGRVALPVLQRLLVEARGGGESLAASLVSRGHIESDELARITAPQDDGETLAWSGESMGPQLGPFRLLKSLGRGAMGAVWLGEHVESGGRYAIKTLPQQAEPELKQRFLREGEAQARVDAHPNVVRVHSAGETATHLYLVQDLASGGDLAQRLRRGPLPPEEAAGLVAALARGLAHVHGHGVLHRDLKPANVLFDEAGAPKLVDFGLARVASEVSALTRTGDLIGTPAYMAPEQARGVHREVDARAEVYGLGAILYHCLTGVPPFAGSTTLEVLTRVVSEAPRPPRELAPAVPPQLEAICLRCLAKEPGERYGSAGALAEALETQPAPRAVAPPTRRAPVALGLAVGALAAALLLGLAWSLGGGAPPAPPADAPRGVAAVSSSGAPQPAPPEPAPPEPPPPPGPALHLRLARGERARGVLAVRGRQWAAPPNQEPGPVGTNPLTGEVSMELGFTFEVLEASGSGLDAELVIDALAVVRHTDLGKVDYRSDRDGADSPFAAALGKRMTVRLDPRTGAVLRVDGTQVIQWHVTAVAAERGLQPGLYELAGFNSPPLMRAALEKVFLALPGDARGERWQLRESVDLIAQLRAVVGGALTQFGLEPRFGESSPLVREVERRAAPDATLLAWVADDETRQASGQVTYRDGRILAAEARERIELRFGPRERPPEDVVLVVVFETAYALSFFP